MIGPYSRKLCGFWWPEINRVGAKLCCEALKYAQAQASGHGGTKVSARRELVVWYNFWGEDGFWCLRMGANNQRRLTSRSRQPVAMRTVCRAAFSPSEPAQTICA